MYGVWRYVCSRSSAGLGDTLGLGDAVGKGEGERLGEGDSALRDGCIPYTALVYTCTYQKAHTWCDSLWYMQLAAMTPMTPTRMVWYSGTTSNHARAARARLSSHHHLTDAVVHAAARGAGGS